MKSTQLKCLAASALLILCLLAPPTRADITTGLVGWWKFDEGTGTTAADSSGNGRAGTLTNGPTWINGKIGKAVSFDANNDIIIVADHSSLDFGPADFTVAGWGRIKSAYDHWNGTLVNKWNTGGQPGTNEWGLGFSGGEGGSGRYPSFNLESGNTVYHLLSTTLANLNQWYHLVGVRRGTKHYLYVDGQLVNQTDIGNIAVNNVGRNLNIGNLYAASNALNGDIDDVRIYNRALSADDVMELYRRGGQTRIRNARLRNAIIR